MSTEIKNLDKYSRMMNYDIQLIIDYLYEEAFYVDKEVIKDDISYESLFKLIYNIFNNNNIAPLYIEEMKNYIFYCIIHNDTIDIDKLINNLQIIKNNLRRKNLNFPNIDVGKMQHMFKVKKKY